MKVYVYFEAVGGENIVQRWSLVADDFVGITVGGSTQLIPQANVPVEFYMNHDQYKVSGNAVVLKTGASLTYRALASTVDTVPKVLERATNVSFFRNL